MSATPGGLLVSDLSLSTAAGWLLALVAGLYLLTVVLTTVYGILVWRIFLNTDVSGPPEPLPEQTPRVRFQATDGLPLVGAFLPSRRELQGAAPTIIFSHQVGVGAGAALTHTDFLRDLGYHVFTFDHRGQGESQNARGYVPRQWVTEGEVADLLGAVEHVAGMAEVDPGRIALFGVSRGACTALAAAARRPEIRGVVLDSVFTIGDTMMDWMRQWASVYLKSRWLGTKVPTFIYLYLAWVTLRLAEVTEGVRYVSVARALRDCRGRDLAFVHGLRDKYINPEQSRRLHERHGGDDSTLLLVPDAKHNGSILTDPDAYQEFVSRFLTRTLRVCEGAT